VVYVVMKALGMVAETSGVVRSQKQRYLRYTVWCCCTWLSLIFIPVLNREKEAMARDSNMQGARSTVIMFFRIDNQLVCACSSFALHDLD
jgi:hypothetical protein